MVYGRAAAPRSADQATRPGKVAPVRRAVRRCPWGHLWAAPVHCGAPRSHGDHAVARWLTAGARSEPCTDGAEREGVHYSPAGQCYSKRVLNRLERPHIRVK